MTAKETIISHNERLEALKDTVNTLPDQVILPELTNPAGAGQIMSGYQAIDKNGEVITGTAVPGLKVLTGTFSLEAGEDTTITFTNGRYAHCNGEFLLPGESGNSLAAIEFTESSLYVMAMPSMGAWNVEYHIFYEE